MEQKNEKHSLCAFFHLFHLLITELNIFNITLRHVKKEISRSKSRNAKDSNQNNAYQSGFYFEKDVIVQNDRNQA